MILARKSTIILDYTKILGKKILKPADLSYKAKTDFFNTC